jgi:N-acyl-phosphatidylethanolamine-hydrolysing phospholipase D
MFRAWRATRRKAPDHSTPPARVEPSFDAPRAPSDVVTITWVGHATLLIQIAGLNVLTDPVWSTRVGMVLPLLGWRRRTPPGIEFTQLPPIDVVLISHNHGDHLDPKSVARLVAAHPSARWLVPLGAADLVRARGARHVVERDWWDHAMVGPLRFTATPTQHHSARRPGESWNSLWCGWAMRVGATDAAAARTIYFVGDTALFPGFPEIAARCGPFAITIFPIGGYMPEHLLHRVHMSPADAVRAYQVLAAAHPHASAPGFVAMHFGTFRFTAESLDDPPSRLRAAWEDAALPTGDLWIPSPGETRRI